MKNTKNYFREGLLVDAIVFSFSYINLYSYHAGNTVESRCWMNRRDLYQLTRFFFRFIDGVSTGVGFRSLCHLNRFGHFAR